MQMQFWYLYSNTFTVGAGSSVRNTGTSWQRVSGSCDFTCPTTGIATCPVDIRLPAGTNVTLSMTSSNGVAIVYRNDGANPTAVRTLVSSPLIEEYRRGGADSGGNPGTVDFFPRTPTIEYNFQFCSSGQRRYRRCVGGACTLIA